MYLILFPFAFYIYQENTLPYVVMDDRYFSYFVELCLIDYILK